MLGALYLTDRRSVRFSMRARGDRNYVPSLRSGKNRRSVSLVKEHSSMSAQLTIKKSGKVTENVVRYGFVQKQHNGGDNRVRELVMLES